MNGGGSGEARLAFTCGDPAGVGPELMGRLLGEGQAQKDADILVICHSGQRSYTVASALADAGFSAIDVLGGMSAWEQAGGAVDRPAAPEPRA